MFFLWGYGINAFTIVYYYYQTFICFVVVVCSILFIAGLLWLGLSLAVRVMTALSVELFDSNTVIMWENFEYVPTSLVRGYPPVFAMEYNGHK